jgi:hypothetical protein
MVMGHLLKREGGGMEQADLLYTDRLPFGCSLGDEISADSDVVSLRVSHPRPDEQTKQTKATHLRARKLDIRGGGTPSSTPYSIAKLGENLRASSLLLPSAVTPLGSACVIVVLSRYLGDGVINEIEIFIVGR